MPFRVYTTADGTQIHKHEKAPPATAATRKPVLTNTKMPLAEGMFDKTKVINIKEALKALKAKKAAAAAAEKPTHPVSYYLNQVEGDWSYYDMPDEEDQYMIQSSILKRMIKMFHKGKTDEEVAKAEEWNVDEVRAIRHDYITSADLRG